MSIEGKPKKRAIEKEEPVNKSEATPQELRKKLKAMIDQFGELP